MAKCPHCHRDVVEAIIHGTATILLERQYDYRTYAGVDAARIYPEDGDRVFESCALVEHLPLCPAARRGQAEQRKARAHARDQRKAAHTSQKGGKG